jgi:hypothetical protein
VLNVVERLGYIYFLKKDAKHRILNKPTAIQIDKRGKFVKIYAKFIFK